MKRNRVPALVSSLVACFCAASAQDAADRTGSYRAGVSQNSLGGATARMKQEIAAVIQDYERYEIAAMEIEKLKETEANLERISTREMPEVARLLMDAGQTKDSGSFEAGFNKASSMQKGIQTQLRSLADKLAVYSDQAAMQKRVEELAVRQLANLRATRDLANRLSGLAISLPQLEQDVTTHPASPDSEDEAGKLLAREWKLKRNLWNDWSRRKQEQSALERELRLATAAMTKVAEDPLSPTATHFKQAVSAAQTGQLETHAMAALTAMNERPETTAAEQQAVFHTLQTMIASLDGARNDEDRLRDMAAQLADLSAMQNGIANRTPRAWGEQKMLVAQDQFSIGDRLEILQNRLSAVNAEASAMSRDFSKLAGELADPMRSDGFTDDAALVTRTTDDQKILAKNLADLGTALETQAEKLSADGQPAAQPEALSPEAAAIQDAMKELVDARINVELASRQNSEKLDYLPRLNQGRRNLTTGIQRAKDAGPVVGDDVHKALAEADKRSQQAANGETINHHLFHTRARINEALTGLQEAAIKLAAQEDQNQQQQQDGGGNTKVKGGGTVIASQGERSDAQRDALSLLKQERAAPEFETMVRQYIKNLAEESEAEP